MKLTLSNQAQIMQYLRNVAEVDACDVIANAASQLAVDMEYWKSTVDFEQLTPLEQQMIRYAIGKRDQYVLVPGHRHAVDLQRVEKARRTLKKG
jgi:hypothetical protein